MVDKGASDMFYRAGANVRMRIDGEVVSVDDKTAMIEKIKTTFADGELNELDGITITYDDFWFNVRASNTESKLRLNLEAIDRATMEKRRDEVIALIKDE